MMATLLQILRDQATESIISIIATTASVWIALREKQKEKSISRQPLIKEGNVPKSRPS